VGDERLAEWQIPGLAPGRTWAVRVTLPEPEKGATDARARLWRTDDPTAPYREVRLWLGKAAGP
jgi:hypothetical protein